MLTRILYAPLLIAPMLSKVLKQISTFNLTDIDPYPDSITGDVVKTLTNITAYKCLYIIFQVYFKLVIIIIYQIILKSSCNTKYQYSDHHQN